MDVLVRQEYVDKIEKNLDKDFIIVLTSYIIADEQTRERNLRQFLMADGLE